MSETNALPWHLVEQKILEEIRWLKLSIPQFKTVATDISGDDDTDRACDCDYRLIALLIITGVVRVREINYMGTGDLWGGLPKQVNEVALKHKHCHEWHRTMMNILDQYFTSDDYEVVTEPNLNWGRADLGLFRSDTAPIYIEVGTTSIKKLRINLQSMPAVTFLLVPEENRVIEFYT